MATVIVAIYECWDRVTSRDCTAHTSPIATIFHGAESSLYSIMGYSMPQCL